MLLLLFIGLSPIVPLVQGACSWIDNFVLPLMISLIAKNSTISAEASTGVLQIIITRTIGTECSVTPFTGVIDYTASPVGDSVGPFTSVGPIVTFDYSTTLESSTLTFSQLLVTPTTGQEINVVWTASAYTGSAPTPASGTYNLWYVQAAAILPTNTTSALSSISLPFITSNTAGNRSSVTTTASTTRRASTSTATPEPSPGPPAGAIAGGVVGGVAALVIIGVGVWYHRRPRSTTTSSGMSYPPREMAQEQGTATTSGLQTAETERKPRKDLRFDW